MGQPTLGGEGAPEPNRANTSVGKDQIHGVQWHRTQVSEAQCYDGKVSTLTQTHTHTDTDTACLTRSVDVVLQRKGDSVFYTTRLFISIGTLLQIGQIQNLAAASVSLFPLRCFHLPYQDHSQSTFLNSTINLNY